MLESLSIRNFAIIENLKLTFKPGFNVLSGETGAGKSIIVQALILLLGGRGYSDLIRKGEKEAVVSGVFRDGVKLTEITRSLTVEGKNKISIDGKATTLSALQVLSLRFIDLATQHENQSLLNADCHRDILDQFAGTKERASYETAYQKTLALDQKRKQFLQLIQRTREDQDYFEFQLKEIRQAHLREGEEEELLREREVARHVVKIGESIQRAESLLDSSDGSSSETLALAVQELERLSQIDASLTPQHGNLETALSLVHETISHLKNYSVSFDPERLTLVEERLDLIGRLKKKYGGSVASLLEKEQELTLALGNLENHDRVLQDLEKEKEGLEKALQKEATELTQKRRQGAKRLATAIEKELSSLGMGKIQFIASVEPLAQGSLTILPPPFGEGIKGEGELKFYEPHGADTIEFLMAPNVGEGIRPMARIASGGELARILLAIKTVLGKNRQVGSYVFDEVDVGVGGAAAEAVGQSLKRLSQNSQVITITHLPQVASLADHHFVIQKIVDKGRTQTSIRPLNRPEREEEIARMLGGAKVTEKVRAHARELLR